jgi:hypothetical protein
MDIILDIAINLKWEIKTASKYKSYNIKEYEHFMKQMYSILNDLDQKKLNSSNYSYIWRVTSYSIPTEKILCEIKLFLDNKKCSQILEVGSGLGLWASILKLCNVNVVATDSHVTDYKNEILKLPLKDEQKDYLKKRDILFYTSVENIDAHDAIKKYLTSCCLFLCWPPSKEHIKDDKKYFIAGDILEQFKGNFLIYNGMENYNYGLKKYVIETGDDKFFELLKKDWIEEKRITRLYDIKDDSKSDFAKIKESLVFYSKKPEPETILDTMLKLLEKSYTNRHVLHTFL